MASAAQLGVYPTGVSSRSRSDVGGGLGGEERATLHRAKDVRAAESDDEDVESDSGERDKQKSSRKPILPPPPPPPRAGKVGRAAASLIRITLFTIGSI